MTTTTATPLIMSLSGTRGIIGDNLHPEIALHQGMAFGMFVGKGPVIVGGDTRVSHDMVKFSVISGLLAVGTDVIDIGQVTTPTVQHLILHHGAKGGMVITASHNPVMWNGIKLMNHQGAFLVQDEFDQVMSAYHSKNFALSDWKTIGKYTQDSTALETHVDRVLAQVDITAIKAANLKVLVDANNSVGALADPILFKKLGVEFTLLHADPSGNFSHDPEPLEKNLSVLKEALKQGRYDIGFAQDADADRLVMLDETGRFIGEDYSLGVCVDQILRQEGGQGQTIVVNLSTSKVIEDLAARHGAKTAYTKIGESYVSSGLRSHNAIAGGEGNGGVIFPKIGWGRDSLVGMTLALKYLAESKQSLSKIVSHYPVYKMLREKISLSDRTQIQALINRVKDQFSSFPQNLEDGVKVSLPEGWIHVRPSNTEPIVRIFIEAPSLEKAKAWFDQLPV